MHILNVNSSIDFKTGGGMAERTFQMSRSLAKADLFCTVLTINTGHDIARETALFPAEVVAIPLLWRRFYIPRFNWKLIRQLVQSADIVHLMGHWTLLNAIVYIAIRRSNKHYVVCPAGALPIFGRSRWLKKIYNFVIGNAIIRNASGWIAVTGSEFSQFEVYGVNSSKVTVIANGINEEDFHKVDVENFRLKNNLPNLPFILFMGRLNLIKGPDLLLKAFILALGEIGDFHIVFAGPDEGMLPELIKLTAKSGISDRVHFLGFIDGFDKVAAYQLATLLVVPSRQEAMSIVALEAGVCGTPTILTDQCGFSEVRTMEARLEVPATVQGISDGLIYFLGQPELLKSLASDYRNFVLERYTWKSIVEKYFNLYRKITAKAHVQ